MVNEVSKYLDNSISQNVADSLNESAQKADAKKAESYAQWQLQKEIYAQILGKFRTAEMNFKRSYGNDKMNARQSFNLAERSLFDSGLSLEIARGRFARDNEYSGEIGAQAIIANYMLG